MCRTEADGRCACPVRGFLPADQEIKTNRVDPDEKTLRELRQRREELLHAIRSYDENIKNVKTGDDSSQVVPPNTSISFDISVRAVCCARFGRMRYETAPVGLMSMQPSDDKKALRMTFRTNNSACVRAVAVFADGIFEGESFVALSTDPNNVFKADFLPLKDVAAKLTVHLYVGSRFG